LRPFVYYPFNLKPINMKSILIAVSLAIKKIHPERSYFLAGLLLSYMPLHNRPAGYDSANNQTGVVLYENPNYTGAFKAMGPGQYLLSDFNDVSSSIRVPAGMGAYIYEHGAADKGYGISVDLLEDVADLSVYNFNDKVSYVSVFYTTNNTHIWIRNAMKNGQFIPGHWERKRAQPLPHNPVAVVSPPIPGPVPTSTTALAVNGANTTITTLGVQKTEEGLKWENAMNNQLGVIGNDFRGIEEIGSACFERASNNIAIPDNLNFWYPQKQANDHRSVVYFKRTLVGNVTSAKQYYKSGTFEDFDANIDIVPDPPFKYLLTDAHKPEYNALMKTQYYGTFTKSGESGCPGSFSEIEAEIADRYRPAENYTSQLVLACINRYGKKIGVYGPWIWDEGHCCHPEIHPAEQVWFSDPQGAYRKFFMSVFCDASGRYRWRSQMDDGTKLKPWAEPPIKGLFAIAFEYNLSPAADATGYPTRKFEVKNIEHNNVIEYPNANQVYNLVYNGHNIVSFVPNNNAFKVSFEQVGLSPNDRNKIRGFLVIETSVGVLTQIATDVKFPGTNTSYKLALGSVPGASPELLEKLFFKKEGGHYYFNVIESSSGGLKDKPVIRRDRQ
jgi:hypothetical protein